MKKKTLLLAALLLSVLMLSACSVKPEVSDTEDAPSESDNTKEYVGKYHKESDFDSIVVGESTVEDLYALDTNGEKGFYYDSVSDEYKGVVEYSLIEENGDLHGGHLIFYLDHNDVIVKTEKSDMPFYEFVTYPEDVFADVIIGKTTLSDLNNIGVPYKGVLYSMSRGPCLYYPLDDGRYIEFCLSPVDKTVIEIDYIDHAP